MTEGSRRSRVVTRRNFLYLTGLAATGVVATACGGGDALPGQTPRAVTPDAQPTAVGQAPLTIQQTAVAAPQPSPAVANLTPTVPKQFKEAPQLAEQARQGTLPPVAERLPTTPFVVQPIEKVGKYGGTWRAATLGPADSVWLARTVDYENLIRWDPEWRQLLPNVAESYRQNQDGTAFTFMLRKGLKWSDGAPLTADDILFWWEDVALNKELNPTGGVPLWMMTGGKPGTIEKVDQHTVTFTFPQPNGLFLVSLAGGGGNTFSPKHYLQQFHQKYNTTNLDQLVREHNVESWVKLFQTKGGAIPGTPYEARWYNPDLPTLFAWKLTQGYGSNTRVAFERNPFYFKVDPAGNQLPYLDRVHHEIIQDREVMVLKALNGEIDMQDRHIGTNQNKAVFTDNMQKGGYHFFEVIPSNMNVSVIMLNLTHKDPVKRQLFQNKDFRVGLSHAINRQEIIDVVFVGQGEPWQAAPRRETPFFNERLAKQYTEYNVQKANELLDKAFPKKDGDGFRLGPDGRRISFVVEVTGGAPGAENAADVLTIVQGHWRRVGVEIQVKTEDRALIQTRRGANEIDAMVWAGDGGLKDALLEMRYYFPFNLGSSYAAAWTAWYNPASVNRTQPEEPPAIVKQQMALYDRIKVTPDEDKQIALVQEILDIAVDQFYVIGIALPPNSYGIVRNNFHNVPQSMYWTGGPYLSPAPTNPCQYFVQ